LQLANYIPYIEGMTKDMTSDPYAGVIWHDLRSLGLAGIAWADEPRESPYDRLPLATKEHISPGLWGLSTCSAGIYVDFRCAAKEIFVRWTLNVYTEPDDYMPNVARSGIDCYGRDNAGPWRWVGSRSAAADPHGEGSLNKNPLDGNQRTYRLYLPLRRRVLNCEVGVREPIAAVARADKAPIVYYGTSIVHGACVGRAGMAHAAQLGRILDREVINLGFCGSALCEPVIADLLGEQDASIYIIDVLPNNGSPELIERLPGFVQRLQQARPVTPILLLGDRVFGDASFMPNRQSFFKSQNDTLQQIYNELCSGGMNNLHLAIHPNWYGEDQEGSADGSHPNDLGAIRMATALAAVVKEIL